MAKRQISLRVSESTLNKIEDLVKCYGTKTETVAVAVDRLWWQEKESIIKGTTNNKTGDVFRQLEHEHYAIQAVNPTRSQTLWSFLIERGWSADQIWEHSPSTGRDAKQPEPDWL